MLYQNLKETERLSRKWLRIVEGAQQEATLREEVARATEMPKTTHEHNGILFTAEGLKTMASGRERVELSMELPTQSIRFNLRKARYEIELYVSKPGQLDVTVDDSQIIRARSVQGKAILDIAGGRMTFSCTSLIQNARVSRYTSRDDGYFTIGPIDVPPGFTSASVVGEGVWDVKVASNYLTWAEVEVGSDGPYLKNVMDRHHKARGSAAIQPDPVPEPHRWIPYSLASQLRDYPKPTYHDEIPTGEVFTDHERHGPTTEPITADIWWDRIGEWQHLLGAESPGFYALGMPWTCVWGKARGAAFAVDLITGSRASGEAEGQYLIAAQNPEDVDIQGAYAAEYSYHEGTGQPEGEYATASKNVLPRQVYIRAEGKGLARKIEIQSRQRWGPEGKEAVQTSRIDLAPYSIRGRKQSHNLPQNGEVLAPIS